MSTPNPGRRMTHPTLDIPDLGPMDHAWDLLGEWQVVVRVPQAGGRGVAAFDSWREGVVMFDAAGVAAGLPDRLTVERVSDVHLTDAGGGAIQWAGYDATNRLEVQATMWPGQLMLFVNPSGEGPVTRDAKYQMEAHRDRAYWLRKYPLSAVPRG